MSRGNTDDGAIINSRGDYRSILNDITARFIVIMSITQSVFHQLTVCLLIYTGLPILGSNCN